ncbi:hypothetical protein G6F16_008750 [Rhizopus arrhizus]|nr:hypothetical protein G6F16_008750 [Rhizopus arrhizus]KAG1184771.1 hypothetical protein G6F36_007443 [Rhizopus arrhizus]
MKGIKPGFQYAHLCQPIIKGGLGLLDPMIQHRCLQFRWLRQLFQDDDPVSCSQVYMKDFVQRFHSMGTTSLLSFFFPPLRATANIHLGSFLPTMYEAMDSFLKKGCSDVQCNPSTLLSLPLLALFSDIPSGHWLLSHNRSKSVRPLLRPDSPPYPRLSGRLVRDLQNRTVTLNNMTWNLILNDYPDPGSVDDFPFVSWLTRTPEFKSLLYFILFVMTDAYGTPYTHDPEDLKFMKRCIEEANKSIPAPSAYCVGAALVHQGQLLSTGYSRELPGNTHAEECALAKTNANVSQAVMYTTMEPCSKRLSGNRPCVDRIIEANIKRVVVGVREPPNLVNCEGIELLEKHNIEVVIVPGVQEACLAPNQHILSEK